MQEKATSVTTPIQRSASRCAASLPLGTVKPLIVHRSASSLPGSGLLQDRTGNSLPVRCDAVQPRGQEYKRPPPRRAVVGSRELANLLTPVEKSDVQRSARQSEYQQSLKTFSPRSFHDEEMVCIPLIILQCWPFLHLSSPNASFVSTFGVKGIECVNL